MINRIYYALFLVLNINIAVASTLLESAKQDYNEKNYIGCMNKYKVALDNNKGDFSSPYNAACCAALANNPNMAFTWLYKAIELYPNLAHYRSDPDFDNLRNDSRWHDIILKLTRKQSFWNDSNFNEPWSDNLPIKLKIAGLSKFWMEARYNFAFFEKINHVNWDEQYQLFIERVMKTKNTLEYYKVMQEFAAKLQDSHSGVSFPTQLYANVYSKPGISTRLIDSHVTIIDVFSEDAKNLGIAIGDIITHINSIPVKEYASKFIKPFIGSSTLQDLNVRVFEYGLLSGDVTEDIELRLKTREDKDIKLVLERFTPENLQKIKRFTPPLEFSILKDNIGLLKLNSFSNPVFEKLLLNVIPEVLKTDGLIIDLRDNGGGDSGQGYRLLSYLTNKPFATSSWSTRLYDPIKRINSVGQRWFESKNNTWSSNRSIHYDRKVILLISPRTFSAAEDMAMAFDSMNRGLIIGSTSGGSTGAPLSFTLPGGGKARICSKKDTYPNGKAIVGIGVEPDIEVLQSYESLINKRDDALDVAIKNLL